jgi:uncharacterized protein
MPTFHFNDAVDMPSSRTTTREGYLITSGVLARAGVYHYRAGELGLQDARRKPEELLPVFRSRAELEKAVESFDKQAIIIGDHKFISGKNWRNHAVGDVHDVRMQNDAMMGTLIVRDADAIRQIQDGKRTQLSNGYSAQILPRAGTYQGQNYAFEQVGIVGNHLLVTDKGRCGVACSIGDSADGGCHCGGSCAKCKQEQIDPREAYKERQQNAWKHAFGELPPAETNEDETDDPRAAWIARHSR